MLVHQLLETSASLRPDSIALICDENRLTYQEIELAANQLAHALSLAGIQRGDRVMILLENSPQVLIALFAALKVGAVFLILHPDTKRDRLAVVLEDASPTVLVTDSIRMREVREAVEACQSLRDIVWTDTRLDSTPGIRQEIFWDSLHTYPADPPGCSIDDRDLAMLIYTSGTTGKPKGIMATHRNMIAAVTSVNTYLEHTAADVILNVLPLAHGYGLYQFLLAAAVGARVVLEKNFAFPARTIALLNEEQVSGLPGVPTLFAMLLKYPALLRREFPALRYLTNAAGPLPISHLNELRAAFPQAKFFSMYGQTECKRISYLPPEELERRPRSVGIAIPNSDVYIVGEDGSRLPPGMAGELVVRGPHVTQGYWRAPELTAQRFRPGANPDERILYTGDLFTMDEEGFLYFIGRKDDMIKSRGEKVSPLEIENVVCRLPEVAEAAVVGVPDAILGQAILLVAAPRYSSGLAEQDLRAHCVRHLSAFMVPKYVYIIPELPRTPNGKVDKRRIAAMYDPGVQPPVLAR